MECDAFARHLQPAHERLVVGKEFEQFRIARRDIVGIARKRRETERSAAATEERANERRHKTGERKSAFDAGALRLRANVIAVVENDRTGVENCSIASTCTPQLSSARR